MSNVDKPVEPEEPEDDIEFGDEDPDDAVDAEDEDGK